MEKFAPWLETVCDVTTRAYMRRTKRLLAPSLRLRKPQTGRCALSCVTYPYPLPTGRGTI